MASSTKRGFSSSSMSISYSKPADRRDEPHPARKPISAALLLLGLGMMGLGLAWKSIYPEQTYWSSEQAQEHSAAFIALKEAGEGNANRRPNQPDPPELVAARARWQKSQAALEAAQSARSRSPILLLSLGAVLAGAGVFSLLNMRDAE